MNNSTHQPNKLMGKSKNKLSAFRRRTFPRLWDSHEGLQYSLGNILCHKLHYQSREEKTFDRNTPWWKSQILIKVLTSAKRKVKVKQSDCKFFPQFTRAPAGSQALKRAQCIPLPGFELLLEPVLPASCPRKAREVKPSITGIRKWKWNQLTAELCA